MQLDSVWCVNKWLIMLRAQHAECRAQHYLAISDLPAKSGTNHGRVDRDKIYNITGHSKPQAVTNYKVMKPTMDEKSVSRLSQSVSGVSETCSVNT